MTAAIQSALDPRGPEAEHLDWLFWLFTDLSAAICAAVTIALLYAIWRRRQRHLTAPRHLERSTETRPTVVVTVLVFMTMVIVLVLTGLSFATQKRLLGRPAGDLVLLVTGHQWWWEVRYEDASPDRMFTTANEIHIAVGRPVTVKLHASDVIHSFWVPSLMGKQDLIPGRENTIQFTAGRPGVYRGQCAEFCGAQHAHMGMLVVAEEPAAFDRWRDGQIGSAADPSELERKRGRDVFLSKPCVLCHTVRGTSAAANVGPDLTHIGSRATVASGTLPLTRGTLAAWVADPQGVKPGSQMPFVRLDADELNAVAAYLEGLK